jgi:diadenosine tetraphosphatase ApaH/serine/threonine PP2A family protein phosphatase
MRAIVISDVHSNIEALDAVLSDAAAGGPPAGGAIDAVWCAGDIVGYGPDPHAVIDRLREVGAQCVAGNHDLAAVGEMTTDDFNPVAAAAAQWTAAQLRQDDRDFLRALPLVLKPHPLFTIVHGSLRDPVWEYLLDIDQAEVQFSLQGTAHSIIGHSHLQFSMAERRGGAIAARRVSHGDTVDLGDAHRRILNPGSVGQPRDGDRRAGYMLYDDTASSGAGTVTWRRVEYDAKLTRQKILDAGLPEFLGDRLLAGR